MATGKILIVGEAWGDEERASGLPFQGPSGRLMNAMLSQIGIRREDCYVTNVFNLQPQPKNDVEYLCGLKAEAIPGYPPIKSGKYIHAKYKVELERLYLEIRRESPALIIAFGATAAWALLATSGIKKIRGAPALLAGPALKAVGTPIKVLPTYHPAAVLREYSLRPIVIADLDKARNESTFPELRRPPREIWVEPTLDDMADFERRFIIPSDDLSVDIETAGDQITCIGFAPTVDRALVVPIIDPTRSDGNYWRTLKDELAAWNFIRRWCGLSKHYVGQNFLYDMHFLWRVYGITFPNYTDLDDTMLLHHALQPEMEKGLGFLATIYTEELPWKFMRTKHETVKQED